jgi:hypothetical protein
MSFVGDSDDDVGVGVCRVRSLSEGDGLIGGTIDW